jgi:hypothetical protein
MEPDKTTSLGATIRNMSFMEKQQLAQEMAGKEDFPLA